MTAEQLAELLAGGENSLVEFKSASVRNESLAKEIVALANMRGGLIILGVEDDGRVSGVENVSDAMERIIQVCRNTIQPSLIPDLSTVCWHDRVVLLIEVEQGTHKPYKVKTNNRYYIRAGTAALEPTQEELIRLLQDGALYHFEVSSLPGTGLATLDPLKWRYYSQDLRGLEAETDPSISLYNLQIMDEQGRLTVAGQLFFGRSPSRTLPQAGLELSAFVGTDATTEVLDSLSLAETIPECIQAGEAFVRRNIRHRPVFNAEHTRRKDIADYEPFVIRELLVNAFAHRDWSIFGQRVRLQLFADRLELFSPGSLPNTLNLQRALAGISYYRNPLIAQMLKDYGLMDKLGRGLQKIMKYYAQKHLPLPKFENDTAFFQVILPKQ